MDARARFEELAKLADTEIQGMLTKIDQKHLVAAPQVFRALGLGSQYVPS